MPWTESMPEEHIYRQKPVPNVTTRSGTRSYSYATVCDRCDSQNRNGSP